MKKKVSSNNKYYNKKKFNMEMEQSKIDSQFRYILLCVHKAKLPMMSRIKTLYFFNQTRHVAMFNGEFREVTTNWLTNFLFPSYFFSFRFCAELFALSVILYQEYIYETECTRCFVYCSTTMLVFFLFVSAPE